MSGGKKNSLLAQILIPPALIGLGLMALWENENRFDYAQAARDSRAISSAYEAVSDGPISFTGAQDQSLMISDDYVEPLQNYNQVLRQAEIYVWSKETKKNSTSWSMRWKSYVEDNERNRGIVQTFSSNTLYPEKFIINDLSVSPQDIHLIDDSFPVPLNLLKLKPEMKKHNLFLQDGNFYKRTNSSGSDTALGDERIHYEGVPIPPVTTYFGLISPGTKLAGGKQYEYNYSFVSQIIGNDGKLHHLIAGDRDTALKAIEAHFNMVKWIVRGIATFVVIFGFQLIGNGLAYFLIRIPIIGDLASTGVFLIALIVGGTLSFLTITAGMMYAHPQISFALLALFVGGIWYLRSMRKKTKNNVALQLSSTTSPVAAQIAPPDLAKKVEITFINIVKLAATDGKIEEKEKKYLISWGRKHGLKDQQIQSLYKSTKTDTSENITATSSDDLTFLISLAMADGLLSFRELNFLYSYGAKVGMTKDKVKSLVEQVSKGSLQPA